ncbi:MAG: phosphotransferase [Candidatus Heimdallarchaeota archaeon]|nr:phosphotransferase [Candidatus Heimdallarchaeota archaeon]MCK4954229.1 phosphotransferase [Candidatus Heimdallarchaeota archaeon]
MPLSVLRITEILESYFQEYFPNRNNIRISDVNSLSKGWETELFSFKLVFKEDNIKKTEQLILRIYPEGDVKSKTKWEYDVLTALYNAGYTVPKTHILELDGKFFDQPFIIMDRIVGRDMGEEFIQALESQDIDTVINEILPRLCQSFVELHNLDWRILPNEIDSIEDISPYYFIDRRLSSVEKELREYNLQELVKILNWLKERKDTVPVEKIAILHRDFHPHNVIISNEDGKSYIVDWPACSIGDYREDLAWSLMLTRAYTTDTISDAILNLYEKISGSKVKEIEYFEVLAILRRFSDIMIILKYGAGEFGLRKEAVQQIKETIFQLRNIYTRFTTITNITIPDLERFIQEVSEE